MEHKQYTLYQNGVVILTTNEWDLREKIEELLEERVGVFVMLQENTDDEEDGYRFYLHSDNEKDLSEEDLERLNDHYGINTHDDEASEFNIKQLLNIEVKEA